VIYALSRALEDELRARKYPLRVSYEGHEEFQPNGDTVIVADDYTTGAVRAPFGNRSPSVAPQGAALAARVLYSRDVPAVIHIFAQATCEGARYADHIERLEKLADAVLTAIYDIGKKAQWPSITISEVSQQELTDAGFEWFGAVFLIRLVCPRAVERLDYEGGPTTATLTDVDTQIQS
jgi:hypothetical protein